MRKITASTFITLDGFRVGLNEDMSRVMNHFNEEMDVYAGELMDSMGTILLGRVTCITHQNQGENKSPF